MGKRIFLTGLTASGKGSVAHEIALRTGGEVVAADSMKIYREMDIGTAKPPAERRAQVPHHLMDFMDPAEDFSTGEYVPLALKAIEGIEARGRQVIICGGTALYLNALLEGIFHGPRADWALRSALEARAEAEGLGALHGSLAARDPAAARKIHPNDGRRIIRALEVLELTGRPMTELWKGPSLRLEPGSFILAGIGWEREDLYRRIDTRVARMVQAGLFEEARALRQRPGGLGRAALQCIGYKEIFLGEDLGQGREEIVARIQQRTRNFAKQQSTWFRRFPVLWIGAKGDLQPAAAADQIIEMARDAADRRG